MERGRGPQRCPAALCNSVEHRENRRTGDALSSRTIFYKPRLTFFSKVLLFSKSYLILTFVDRETEADRKASKLTPSSTHLPPIRRRSHRRNSSSLFALPGGESSPRLAFVTRKKRPRDPLPSDAFFLFHVKTCRIPLVITHSLAIRPRSNRSPALRCYELIFRNHIRTMAQHTIKSNLSRTESETP